MTLIFMQLHAIIYFDRIISGEVFVAEVRKADKQNLWDENETAYFSIK